MEYILWCSTQHISTVHSLQVVGVSFLMLLKQQGIPGSILADEMGLGKTAQAICFLGMFIAFVNHVISAWSMCSSMAACHITGCIMTTRITAGILKHAEQDPGPHLIVAPASLLENWQRELQRWCPGLEVVKYYGSDRGALRQQLLYSRCAYPAICFLL